MKFKNKLFSIVSIVLLSSCAININLGINSSSSSQSLSSNSSISVSTDVSSTNSSNQDSSSEISSSSIESSSSSSSEVSSSSSIESSSSSSSSEELTYDPYTDVTFDDFYASYTPATSYKDAYYRTQHGFMSGSIAETQDGYYPHANNKYTENDKYVKISDGKYTYRDDGGYESFVINGTDTKIYYGGGYILLEEVAAYIQAFGEVPPNNNYDKGSSGKQEAIATWGRYGRVNVGYFSGDTSKYKYEPLLPELSTKSYIETDIGSLGGFDCNGTVSPYYDNGRINRGVCRIVYTSTYKNGTPIKDIKERHVFYTYNHYNDFQEYLNYDCGWGTRFGNESAGNNYNYYNPSNPPSDYPNVVLKKLSEVL